MRAALLATLACAAVAGEDPAAGLLRVRRVYVDKLGGGEAAQHVRDMLISSLHRSGAFLLTENEERADAFLRGSAEDLIFTETHQTSESLNARASASLGTRRQGGAYNRGPAASIGVGESESMRIAERKHEANAAVRLVNRDGDVLWSTTQESLGAKFKGASADVADKIVKQLLLDLSKAKRQRASEAADPNPLPR